MNACILAPMIDAKMSGILGVLQYVATGGISVLQTHLVYFQVICSNAQDIKCSGLQKISVPYKLLSVTVGTSFCWQISYGQSKFIKRVVHL